MEPSDTEWFIVFCGKYFRLKLAPGLNGPKLVKIELARGNVNKDGDIIERVVFPYSIIFCIYKDVRNSKITGAFLPELIFNKWIGC